MANFIPKLIANLPLVLLSIALAVGAIWAHRAWREAHGEDDDSPETPEDLLEQFREAHATGELDDSEFARVRQLLTGARSAAPRAAHALDHRAGETPPNELDGDPPQHDTEGARPEPAPPSSPPAHDRSDPV